MSIRLSHTPHPLGRAALALAATAALGLTALPTTQAAPTAVEAPTAPSAPSPGAEKDVLVDFVMARDGVSRAKAQSYLDAKHERQAAMRALEKRGVDVDGAYFKGERLVVVVGSDADASAARTAGLVPSRAAGQSELDARAATILRGLGSAKDEISSIGSDVTTGTVSVRLAPGASAAVRRQLAATPGVTVTQGDTLSTQADVYPGRIMDLAPGTNCSLGYPGKTASGNNVLLTAGHCVEGLPDIYDANGTHIGKGTSSRFRTGSSSVDMGLMDIDSEDRGVPQVDSRGHSGYYAVKGMSKNAVGTEICKAGNTTGWTCGTITAYNRTVNYGGTVTSGLAEASVCTEGGDSGGAYIGVGNLAQGMTSGGPVGVDCGYNRGYSAGSYSFYQPVVDAASYYGVTIDRM